MVDNHKVCWYCGKAAMKPVETWYQCKSCGATYIDPVSLNPQAGDFVSEAIRGKDGDIVGHALKPSRSARREATKVRVKKAAVV